MKFIGQERIIKEINILLPQIRDRDLKMNFLLRGKSGYGKTTLGLKMCCYISNGNYQYFFGDSDILVEKQRKVIFIDEIHLLEKPEMLYKMLDDKEQIFIFATNEYSNLKEPLENRCTVYTFEDYTKDELLTIARNNLTSDFSKEMLEKVCDASQNNPRKIQNICIRLDAISNSIPIRNIVELDYVIEKILGIINGMDVMTRKYMEVINELKVCSLRTLVMLTGINERTILYEIEPMLLLKKLITITSKGRSII